MARASRSREPALGHLSGRLNEQAVAEAALALVDRGGLDALTMRALGQVLGVEAMSLYHWFPSKEHLLDAVADRLLARIELPPAPDAAGWRHWLVETARSYRRVGLAHPRAFALLATRRFLSPGATAFVKANVAAHVAAGFTAREAVRLTRSIAGFVNGIVMLEVAPAPAAPPSMRRDAMPDERQADRRRWNAAVRALRQPALDGAFEFGLACLLDGIRRPAKRRR